MIQKLVGLMMLVGLVVGFAGTAEAAWYDSDWLYRKPVTISSSAPADYQVQVSVSRVSGHMQDNFDDIRFTKSDGTNLLPHWKETSGTTDPAIFWVKVNSIPQTIYMYYGNPSATSASNGDNTFPFFDHFPGTSIDTTKWPIRSGTIDVANSLCTITCADTGFIVGNVEFGVNYLIRAYSKGNADYYCLLSGFNDLADDNVARIEKNLGSAKFEVVTGKAGTACDIESAIDEDTNYHTFDVGREGTTAVKYWIDEVLEYTLTDTTYIPTIDLMPIFGQAGSGVIVTIDWILVRKYASPEPTASVGDEEPQPPTITISAATSVEETTARLNGNVTDIGGENPTVTVYWGTSDGGQTPGSWTNNSVPTSPGQPQGAAAFYKDAASLSPGTLYYFSAKATNSGGTDWPAASLSFTTKPAAPTNVAATDGDHTDKVTITWTKSTGATDYHVWRDAVDLGAAGDVAAFDDTGADAPTITAGTAAASDGTSSAHVALNLSGQSANDGTTHTYKVVASNATGDSADSTTDNGYRGVGSLTYQWQRSAADSDASYSDIVGATTASYNDTGAPVNGDGRYYKCVEDATDASQQTSTANRGYRAIGVSTITISAATSVEETTARLNGNVTDIGGENPTVTVYWGTSDGGQTPGSWTNNSVPTSPGQPQGVAAFYKDATSLSPGTLYYFSAKATNSGGTDWPAASLSFTTKPAAPTNVAATDGDHTDKVTITWTKSTGATDYHVWRDAVDLGAAGDVAAFDDTGADAPTITAGTAAASDGTSSAHVALSLSGQSANNGTTHTYKVVASNATGDSADSTTDNGYRGVGSLTYQWQRSAADSDASYSDIVGATTASYNDTGAPADGSGRYYKCVEDATDASQETSTADRGYRAIGVPTVTTQAASSIGAITATGNGNITVTGGENCDERGVEWGTTSGGPYPNSATDSGNFGAGAFTKGMTGLSSGTTYYYRAKAHNSAGWAYGGEQSFTTLSPGDLTISAGDNNPAAETILNNATNEEMAQLKLTAGSSEGINISSITFTGSGTGDEANDITASSVKLYNDVNNNGAFDSGTDTQIGTDQSWSGDNGTVTFSGLSESISQSSSENWILICSFAGGIDDGKTFQVSLVNNSDITGIGAITAQSITPSGAAVAGGVKTIGSVSGAPTITVPGNGKTLGTEITVIGTAPAGSTVTIKDQNGNTVGTTTADSEGNYRLSLSALSAGTNELTPYAGETAGSSRSVTIVSSPTRCRRLAHLLMERI